MSKLEIGDSTADATFGQHELFWLTVIHVTFVFSGLLMAAMDWLVSRTAKH